MPDPFLEELRRRVCSGLDIYYETLDYYTWAYAKRRQEFLHEHVRDPWFRIYDLCEVIWEFTKDRLGSKEAASFENVLNEVLRRNFCGYEMREGLVERVGAKASEEVIATARGILRDGRLVGPNDQFLKALGFFNQRPKPDTENCVKEAVGALEGTLRVALDDPKILLSDALKKLQSSEMVPPTLKKSLDGIYAFRGDAGGVAHGQAEEPNVTVEQAEFVLHCAAAAIVYFARMYGFDVA
jgi:hypothetical protein